jgi:ribosome maturation factor RimP
MGLGPIFRFWVSDFGCGSRRLPDARGDGRRVLGVAVREALIRLLEPEVEALGYELVELEFAAHRSGGLLRLYIDVPRAIGADIDVPRPLAADIDVPAPSEDAFDAQSQGGVHVDDCEKVSRRVSEVLDVSDPIKGGYTLEVSSPGFDRPLRKHAHWVRFAGSRVKVETSVPRDGRRRWTGTIVAVTDGSVELEVDGQRVELGLDEIRHARIVPDFGDGVRPGVRRQ